MIRITPIRLAACLAFVLIADAFIEQLDPPLPVVGVIDPPAHLLTAVLLLAAVRPPLSRILIVAALAASVLIDLDHLPQYLGWGGLEQGLPRPATHSLATVLVLGAAAALTRGRVRQVAAGAALGVALHLARDVATGPRVALLWPLSGEAFLVPYLAYALPLAGATAVAALRARGRGLVAALGGDDPAADPEVRPGS